MIVYFFMFLFKKCKKTETEIALYNIKQIRQSIEYRFNQIIMLFKFIIILEYLLSYFFLIRLAFRWIELSELQIY